MNISTGAAGVGSGNSRASPTRQVHAIPVLALGMALSLLLAISYVLCALCYLFWPNLPIEDSALSVFLPGFKLLTWTSFFLGFVESFGWGWYIALIFAPLYNFFASRF